jgi:hypothetical protein
VNPGQLPIDWPSRTSDALCRSSGSKAFSSTSTRHPSFTMRPTMVRPGRDPWHLDGVVARVVVLGVDQANEGWPEPRSGRDAAAKAQSVCAVDPGLTGAELDRIEQEFGFGPSCPLVFR